MGSRWKFLRGIAGKNAKLVSAVFRTFRCDDGVEVLCGCVSGRSRRSRDAGGKAMIKSYINEIGWLF